MARIGIKRTKAPITSSPMPELGTLVRPNQSQELHFRRRQTIQFGTHLLSSSGLTGAFQRNIAGRVRRDYQMVLISNERIRPSRLNTGTL